MQDNRYYGQFGGQYVSESLMNTLNELEKAFDEAMNGKTTANTTTTKKKHPIKDFFEKDKDK